MCISSFGYAHQSVPDFLESISYKEREDLSSLFYEIMNYDHGAYTLFYDKPVTLSGDFTSTPYGNIFAGMAPCYVFWKKWNLWNELKGKLQIRNYLFLHETSKLHNDISFVIFINKDAFKKCIIKNKVIFQEILGKIVEPEIILAQLETRAVTFQEFINNSQILWGILLGYGEENAKLFSMLTNFSLDPSRDDIPNYAFKPQFINNNLDEIKLMIADLSERAICHGDYDFNLLLIGSVHFKADKNSLETKSLKRIYQSQREGLSEIYSKGDFLEITLEKLSK